MTKKEKQRVLLRINEKEDDIQRTEKRLSKLYTDEDADINRIERLEEKQYIRHCERNAMIEALQIVCKDTEQVKQDFDSKIWFIYSTIHDDLNIYQ